MLQYVYISVYLLISLLMVFLKARVSDLDEGYSGSLQPYYLRVKLIRIWPASLKFKKVRLTEYMEYC